MTRATWLVTLSVLLLLAAASRADSPVAGEYRVPKSAAVVRLLTATQTPQGVFNARSGRIALVYRETLVPVGRIARPHLGLAGFWLDPEIELARNHRYSRHQLREIESLVEEHSDELIAAWQQHFGG